MWLSQRYHCQKWTKWKWDHIESTSFQITINIKKNLKKNSRIDNLLFLQKSVKKVLFYASFKGNLMLRLNGPHARSNILDLTLCLLRAKKLFAGKWIEPTLIVGSFVRRCTADPWRPYHFIYHYYDLSKYIGFRIHSLT